MTDVFKFEQQEEGERELVLLVGPRGPLPHQRYATHSDIKAALAEKELCVVPKGRHDWVFAEEVMKRDEEIARLTAERAEANARADLAGAQLLIIGSELCGDPKIDPQDRGDPRWTPTLVEAARIRVELSALRARVECGDTPEEWAEARRQLWEQAKRLEAERDEARLRQEDVERDIRSMFDLEGDADWPAVVAGIRMAWRDVKKKLTAEQQRRQEVERDRDGWKRAAESQNRQWSKKCAQLTDVRAELERAERELASCRKVVEAAKALVRRRFAAADDADGHGTTYRAHAAEWERLEQALASAGNDSGEALGPDGESPPEVSGRCRVCQGRGRELRCRRVETCTACDGTGRQTIGEVGAGSVGAAVGNEAGTEGADPSGLLRSAQPAPSKPANPGELSANPQSPNPPGIPESSNSSKSSNGSTDPPGIPARSVRPDKSDPLPWRSDVYGKIYDANDHYISTAPRTSAFIVARCNAPEPSAKAALSDWQHWAFDLVAEHSLPGEPVTDDSVLRDRISAAVKEPAATVPSGSVGSLASELEWQEQLEAKRAKAEGGGNG